MLVHCSSMRDICVSQLRAKQEAQMVKFPTLHNSHELKKKKKRRKDIHKVKKNLIGANNELYKGIKECDLREGHTSLSLVLDRKPCELCKGFLPLFALQRNS